MLIGTSFGKKRYGINGHLLSALKALYRNVKCAVKINQTLSDWFVVGSGVKQGFILSPTLFTLYTDDLVERLKEKVVGVKFGDCMLSTLLYADDIVLTSPDVNDLQESIKVVEEWCRSSA